MSNTQSHWFRYVRSDVPLARLGHTEVLKFAEWAQLKEERQMRDSICSSVSSLVNSLWPNCKVVVYGSFDTDLCVPQSDIDLVVLGEHVNTEANRRLLAQHLYSSNIALGQPIIIDSAKVPIIKFNHESGSLVDISFDCSSGPANSVRVKQYIHEFPMLRPLTLVVKYYLKQEALNTPWSGGLGSYTLVLLILSFLQLHTKSKGKLEAVTDEENLASMLIAFFHFYGFHFSYENFVVSVLDNGRYLKKEDKGWLDPQAPSLLSVEDPLIPENDIGSSTFRIDEVKAAFATAAKTLAHAYYGANPPPCPWDPHCTQLQLPSTTGNSVGAQSQPSQSVPSQRPKHSFLSALLNVPPQLSYTRTKLMQLLLTGESHRPVVNKAARTAHDRGAHATHTNGHAQHRHHVPAHDSTNHRHSNHPRTQPTQIPPTSNRQAPGASFSSSSKSPPSQNSKLSSASQTPSNSNGPALKTNEARTKSTQAAEDFLQMRGNYQADFPSLLPSSKTFPSGNLPKRRATIQPKNESTARMNGTKTQGTPSASGH